MNPLLSTLLEKHFGKNLPACDGLANFLDELNVAFENDQSKNKLEQELIQSQKQRQELFQNNPHIICTHDLDGTIISINQAGIKLLGYHPDFLIGKKINSIFPPTNQQDYLGEYLEKFRDSKIAEGIFKIKSKDGNKLCLTYKNHKIHYPGEAAYILVFAEEISDKIKAEKVLSLAKTDVEIANKTKELFLSNMSHEIKTPMNGIIGLTKLLLKTKLNDQQSRYANSVKQSAENLSAVFDGIFDYNKLKSGNKKVQDSPFDLSNLFYNLNRTFKAKANAKKLEIISTIDDDIYPIVSGDVYKLNRVLMHLINNAIKFTETGIITISADLIKESKNAYQIKFLVSDTGVGIPEHKIENIFQSFTIASAETNSSYGGIGIGLSVVNDLLFLLGSSLQIESKYEYGSIFSFELKLKKSDASSLSATITEDEYYEGRLKGLKILLAEDNRVNQLFASELINDWGAELDIADNGRIAIELYSKNEYDLILMDIQMPELDGIDATHIIRNQFPQHKRNIPIIAITANAKSGEERNFINYGMNDVIFKPYSSSKLFHLIQRHAGLNSIKINKSSTYKTELMVATQVNKLDFKYASMHVLEGFSRGKEAFMCKMLQAIIETVPLTLAELNNAILKNDWLSVNKFSHKLIPNMNMTGNEHLEKEMKWVEDHSCELDAQNQIINKWPSIKEELEKTLEELQQANTFFQNQKP